MSARVVRAAQLVGPVAASATVAGALAWLAGVASPPAPLVVLAWVAVAAGIAVALAAGSAARGESTPRAALWSTVPVLACGLLAAAPVEGWLRVAGPAVGAVAVPLAIGQLERDRGRRARGSVMVVGTAALLVVGSAVLLTDPFHDRACRLTCTPNALAVAHVPGALAVAEIALGTAAAAWCVARARARENAPAVAVAACGAVVWLASGLGARVLRPDAVALATAWVAQLLAVVVALTPQVVASWRLVRRRVRIARLATDLTRSGPLDVERWLRDVAHDETVQVVPLSTPVPQGRAVISVTRSGAPAGLVVHDPAAGARLERALTPLVVALVANAARRAEEADKLERLVAARRQIVRRSDAARMTLERDLHDGAQQRLLLLGLLLGSDAPRTPHDVRLRERAARAAADALHEVRRLSHGAVPPVLASMGLVEALRTCVEESTVPCSMDGPARPLPPLGEDVERAVYRAVATQLGTAARADATGARVRVTVVDDTRVRVAVEQDRWSSESDEDLADRVGAVRGTWERRTVDGRSVGLVEVPCG